MKSKKKLGFIRSNSDGFSLVELVIVIAILAILATLLIPRITNYVYEAKHSREINDARMLAGEVSTYNALAKLNGTDTIPLALSGSQELTKTMLDSTILSLANEDDFPDNTVVKIYVDSDGNTSIVY